MSDENTEQSMVLLEERRVDFYGDHIVAVLVRVGGDERIYVPVKLLCDYMGLTWGSQYNRIRRDEVLNEGVFIMKIPSAGGEQDMLCLPLDLIPGWLFGITTRKLKPELQEKIARYRRECFRVLWNAFKHDVLPATELAPAPGAPSGAALAYEIATAVQHLARQQLELEQRMARHDERLERAARWAQGMSSDLSDLRERVGNLEMQVGPAAHLSEQQAAEVSLAVKNVGRALEAQGQRAGYSQVYAEMYRRYGISSYKNLPRDKFDEVLAWLHQWYTDVSGAPPQP
jgi:hypothetical protein